MEEIIINKEDVRKNIYFIISLAQNSDGPMHSRTGSKRDLMGGIFDRWINTTTEKLVFNKIIIPSITDRKDVEVVSDYYKYDPKIEGNAPDVLGLKINNKIIPFAEFNDGWKNIEAMPQIEVKTLKGSHKMETLVVETGYLSKYLVFLEANLKVDYLATFLKDEYFNDSIYESMKMNDDIFINSNNTHNISMIDKLKIPSDDLGTLKLSFIIKGQKFKDNTLELKEGESPICVNDIVSMERIAKKHENKILAKYCYRLDNGLYRFRDNWYTIKNGQTMVMFPGKTRKQPAKYLDFSCEKIEDIRVYKKKDKYMYILSKSDNHFNEKPLEKNKLYKVEYNFPVDRSSSNNKECFIEKSLISYIPTDNENLYQDLKKIIDEN